jgi:glycerophosphoryl diester phosphodiesterase
MFFKNCFKKAHLVAAHRGVSALRAENTMAAFRLASGRNDFVELDVGFSRDGEAVIIHDSTLERTSNAKELPLFTPPYNVTDYTFEELRSLDISSWFIDSDPFGTIVSGLVSAEELRSQAVERMPTLREALDYFKRVQMPVNVEIKDMSGTVFDETAAGNVVKIVLDADSYEQVVISSFNHEYLKQCHRLAPDISTAALVEGEHPEDITDYLLSLHVDAYHAESSMLDKAVVDAVMSRGMAVNAYTVDSMDEMNRLFGIGVCAVFSNILKSV